MINKNLSAQDILKGRTAKDILKGRTAKDILGNKTTTNLLDTQKQKTQTFEFEDIDYSGFDKEQSKNNLTKPGRGGKVMPPQPPNKNIKNYL